MKEYTWMVLNSVRIHVEYGYPFKGLEYVLLLDVGLQDWPLLCMN